MTPLRAILKNAINCTAAVAAAAAFLLTSCGQSGDPVSGTVKGFKVDPGTGRLSSITVHVSNTSDAGLNVDFIVHNGNSLSYWDAKTLPNGTLPPRSTQDLTLTSEVEATGRPIIGDTVGVYLVRKDSGKESPLGAIAVDGVTQNVVNPSFSDWRVGSLGPNGWIAEPSQPGDSTSYGRTTTAGKSGIELSVQSKDTKGWHSAFVTQPISPDRSSFLISIFPRVDCDGMSSAPHTLAGLELTDDFGHSILFCVSPTVKQQQYRQINGGYQLIVVSPGKLNSWNELSANLSPYRALLRLIPNKEGTVQIRPVVSIFPSETSGRVENDSAAAIFADLREE